VDWENPLISDQRCGNRFVELPPRQNGRQTLLGVDAGANGYDEKVLILLHVKPSRVFLPVFITA